MIKKYLLILITSLSSAWMIGISARFLSMGSYDTYMINNFDRVFDFGMLLLLGAILFCYSVYKFRKEMENDTTKNPVTKLNK